jgi:NAD(P)-dependent dehydrogenase (short-subunit alcohol dehydrogenase family)
VSGRLVVVTGGGGGIGRALAARFAGDEVLAPAHAQLDVADEAAVGDFFAGLEPDVLVNNAGWAESSPLARTSLASWQRHLAVNATGAFLCTRAVAPGMRSRGRGAIVTVASTAGRAGTPYTAAYSASKHAAVGLMRAVAAELAGTGVTANAVCPTFVDTPMTDRSVETIERATGRTDAREALSGASPLGRLLDPDEVAAAVAWLASPDAAAISGQAVVLDGGGIQA